MTRAIGADLSGRVAVVTGASTGIGKEIARGLARLGAHVVMACRSAERGEPALRETVSGTGNRNVEVMPVDLASQASIRGFVRTLRERHERIHILVNNAGVWQKERACSPEGIEMTWAVNVLAYYMLTDLLLPLLRAGAPARVVNVASKMAWGLSLQDPQMASRRFNGAAAYAQSKQADRMLTWAFARRLAGSGVTANAVHPGGVATDLFRQQGGVFSAVIFVYAKTFARSTARGADTAVWLAASPEVEGLTGEFWQDRKRARCEFRGEEREEALWALCTSMIS